jgi:hypothetical protein
MNSTLNTTDYLDHKDHYDVGAAFGYFILFFLGIILLSWIIDISHVLDPVSKRLSDSANHNYCVEKGIVPSHTAHSTRKCCGCEEHIENYEPEFFNRLSSFKSYFACSDLIFPGGLKCLCGLISFPPGMVEDFMLYQFNNASFLAMIFATHGNSRSRDNYRLIFFSYNTLAFMFAAFCFLLPEPSRCVFFFIKALEI